MGTSPKAPRISPAQLAFEKVQATAIGKEIDDENRRRKALIRGQLGVASLLSGLPVGGGSPTVAAATSGLTAPTGVLTGASPPPGGG